MPFDLPEHGAARDQAILTHLSRGDLTYRLAPLLSTIQGHTATFQVFGDAMMYAGVRFGVGARVAQQIADVLGCLLLTPKLLDLMFLQAAVTITPQTDPTVPETSAGFVKHSGRIDKASSGFTGPGILQTTGKPWMITNALAHAPGRACNYGWNLPKATKSPWQGVAIYPSVTLTSMVIQQPGTAHGLDQDDYSETVSLVSRACVVDGKDMLLEDVLRDPALAPLASHEGVLTILRQPGVPIYACSAPLKGGSSSGGITATEDDGSSGTEVCSTAPKPTSSKWPWIVGGTAAAAGVAAGAWWWNRLRHQHRERRA